MPRHSPHPQKRPECSLATRIVMLSRSVTKCRHSGNGPRFYLSVAALLPDHGHPCKSLSTEKHKIFWARSGERAISLIRIRGCATVPLGWWFLLSAEPDIHLLSETPKSPHRRSSLCSLPVPKQPMGASGVASVAQPVTCGTWQPAHRVILMVFHSREGFHAAAVSLRFPVSTKFCFLRSTASM